MKGYVLYPHNFTFHILFVNLCPSIFFNSFDTKAKNWRTSVIDRKRYVDSNTIKEMLGSNPLLIKMIVGLIK